MALEVFSGEVCPPSMQSVTLVLDASESTDPCWDQIATLAGMLLSTLPAEAVKGLFFLGNPEPYAASLFPTMQHSWREANRHRASLITPIFESLSDKHAVRILVVGSERIFDLEDWKGTALLASTLLVSLGDSLQAGKPLAEELLNPSCDEVLRRLHDPIQAAELTGKGFMPLEWDNGSYQLALQDDRAVLRAERAQDYALRVQFLARRPPQVKARFAYASGKILELDLRSTSPPPSPCIPLSAEEVEVLQRAIRRQPFRCPRCAKQHDWNTLQCEEGVSILGEPIYASLQDLRGYAVFHLTNDGVFCRPHQSSVLQLGEDVIAIREGGQAYVYRYDAPSDTWRPTGQTMQPYHPIAEGVYAVLL
ncbi:MAG: hypothetical protein K6U12_10360 [Armatimonadetes bacterium]|nr:hypothetical protein [Armatimonadota bacterium]